MPGNELGQQDDFERERLAALHSLRLLDTPAEPVFDRITRLAAKLCRTPIAGISLADEHRHWFKSIVGIELSEVPREHAFCEHTIAPSTSGTLVVADASRDPRFASNPCVVHAPQLRFYAGAALQSRDGHRIGALWVADGQARTDFGDADVAVLEDLAALVVEQFELRRQARHIDAGTGLSNIYRLYSDLQNLADTGQHEQTYVVMVDPLDATALSSLLRVLGVDRIDRDMLLFAARITELAPQLRIYRAGLTRVALVRSGISEPDLQFWLTELEHGLRQPLRFHSGPVELTPRFGISRLEPGADAGTRAAREAQAATNDALELHRPWAYFDASRDAGKRRRLHLRRGLRPALAEAEHLRLEYRPRIDLHSGACTGAEALPHWHHPQQGHVPHDELLPLAAAQRALPQLTSWVVAAAIRDSAAWRAQGHALRIAINVGTQDFADGLFGERMATMFMLHGADPADFEFELSEDAFGADPDRIEPQLQALQRLGSGVIVDHFGTGVRNFMHLKRITATTAKVDAAFVRATVHDPHGERITRSIVAFAHDLGYRVTADGADSDDIIARMRSWGCDAAQGDAVAPPLSGEAMNAWLTREAQRLREATAGSTAADSGASPAWLHIDQPRAV